MYLSKRNNIYYLWYRDSKGKKQKISTRTGVEGEAAEFLKSFKIEENRTPRSKAIHLREFAREIQAYAEGNFVPGWSNVYRKTFSTFIDFFGSIPISSLTPYHIDQYKLRRIGAVKGQTVNREMEVLRAALNMAVRWRYLKENPFARYRKVAIPERKVNFFTHEEFDGFLSAFKEQWFRDLLVFTLHTGLRRSEVVNVKWENIDLRRKTILIVSDETFKTKSRRLRVLPMSHEVEGIVQRQPRVSPYLFTFQDKKIREGFVTRRIKETCRIAGIRPGLTLQALRHTYASWMVQNGVPIYSVSKLLGHSTVSVTQKHYASLETSGLHAEVNRVFSMEDTTSETKGNS